MSESEQREVHDIMARMFVGHPKEDVIRVCELLRARCRILRIDGKACMGTCDYDS